MAVLDCLVVVSAIIRWEISCQKQIRTFRTTSHGKRSPGQASRMDRRRGQRYCVHPGHYRISRYTHFIPPPFTWPPIGYCLPEWTADLWPSAVIGSPTDYTHRTRSDCLQNGLRVDGLLPLHFRAGRGKSGWIESSVANFRYHGSETKRPRALPVLPAVRVLCGPEPPEDYPESGGTL